MLAGDYRRAAAPNLWCWLRWTMGAEAFEEWLGLLARPVRLGDFLLLLAASSEGWQGISAGNAGATWDALMATAAAAHPELADAEPLVLTAAEALDPPVYLRGSGAPGAWSEDSVSFLEELYWHAAGPLRHGLALGLYHVGLLVAEAFGASGGEGGGS